MREGERMARFHIGRHLATALLICFLVCVCTTAALAVGGGGSPDPDDSAGPRACGGQRKGKKAGGDDDGCGSPVGSVNTFTGDLTIDDIPVWYEAVGEAMPFTISYSAQGGGGASMGEHWTHNFNARIITDGPYGQYLEYGNGWKYYFASDGEGGYLSPVGIYDGMSAWGTGIQVTIRSKKRCCGRRGGGGGGGGGGRLWRSLPPDLSDIYFDQVGLLTEIEDPDGLTWTLTYNAADRLTTITDPLGRDTTLSYTNGLLTQVTVPGGLYATFQYDTHDPKRLWKITDAAGDTYTFGYSGTRVTSITGPSGKQVWYTYGTFNNKTVVTAAGITDVSESTETYTYTEKTTSGQLWVDVTEEKDSLDRVTRYIYEFDTDDTDGAYYGTLLEVIADQGGLNLRHTLAYDSERRVIAERDSYTAETGGKDHVDRYYYGDSSNPNQVTKFIDAENWTGSPSTSPAYLYTYDGLGNLTDMVTPEGRVAEIAYVTGTKRVSSVTIEDEDINGDPVDRITSFGYWGSGTGYRLPAEDHHRCAEQHHHALLRLQRLPRLHRSAVGKRHRGNLQFGRRYHRGDRRKRQHHLLRPRRAPSPGADHLRRCRRGAEEPVLRLDLLRPRSGHRREWPHHEVRL
jgi:YD repeat-containing protein